MKTQAIKLNNYIEIVSPVLLEKKIKDIFEITNPDYLQICKRRGLKKSEYPKGFILSKTKIKGRWTTKKIPEWLFYWNEQDNLLLPREGLFELKKLYKKNDIKINIIEKREEFPSVNFTFNGELNKKKGQLKILKWKSKKGILQSPTGSGKTVMACWKIAQIKQPTVIVVDTVELLNQWKERINQFLLIDDKKIKSKDIGEIGGGKQIIRPITVALIQTLKKHPKLLRNYGLLLIDECHVMPTDQFSEVINNYHGPYIEGLSATPFRKDGKTIVMHWYLGETKIIITPEETEKAPCKVKFVPTDFKTKLSFQKQYSKSLVKLTQDNNRNKLIANTVLENIEFFGIHLILSSSTKHLKMIYDELPEHIKLITHFLTGGINKKQREETVFIMGEGKIKLIFATIGLLKKGFDEKLLTVLHLVTPVKDKWLLEQIIGRITRVCSDKEHAIIFDYFDKNERILRAGAKTRSGIYTKLKITKLEGA